MAEAIFLGTGGGRIVVLNQFRATGGIALFMNGMSLHIDPGPGALVRARQYGIKLGQMGGVLISHCHPDHYTDGEVVIEAMTLDKVGTGFLIASKAVIEGHDNYRPVISPYHLSKLAWHKTLSAGEHVKEGGLTITATPTRHEEPTAIGFLIEKDGKRFGYTSDTEYFSGLERHFKAADILVVNCLRPRGQTWPEHMNSEGAKTLIERAKPKMAVLSHFGMKMLRGVAEREAEWIEKETGIKTIAARDGQRIEF
ncbi:MAG: MBL fold metallo-hydrolase [Candidatus Aenigmatarchaeota archaeon]